MLLKQPCQHGRYDEHSTVPERDPTDVWEPGEIRGPFFDCPGGVLLPPDSLIQARIVWANDVTYDRRIYTESGIELEDGDYWIIPLDALAAAQPGTETVTTFEAFNVHVQEAP